MTNYELLNRLAGFIQELTVFYGELSEELPNLRIVADNPYSELKKIARERFYSSRAQRRNEATTLAERAICRR